MGSTVSRARWAESCTAIGYSSRQDWCYLAPLGTTQCVPQESRQSVLYPCNTSVIDQACWSRWLDIGLVLFFGMFMDPDSILVESIHKHGNKELGQYPAILTENALLITHTCIIYRMCMLFTLYTVHCAVDYYLFSSHVSIHVILASLCSVLF